MDPLLVLSGHHHPSANFSGRTKGGSIEDQRRPFCDLVRFVERLHKTMKDEFYSIIFRKKLIFSLEELQKDLDEWMDKYNTLRPHSGKYCYGKTPLQTFEESKHIALEKQISNNVDLSDNENRLPKTA